MQPCALYVTPLYSPRQGMLVHLPPGDGCPTLNFQATLGTEVVSAL